jgi:hypothetical protein
VDETAPASLPSIHATAHGRRGPQRGSGGKHTWRPDGPSTCSEINPVDEHRHPAASEEAATL